VLLVYLADSILGDTETNLKGWNLHMMCVPDQNYIKLFAIMQLASRGWLYIVVLEKLQLPYQT
jgi:hypothetical protein